MSPQDPPANPILVLLGTVAVVIMICLAGLALYEAGEYVGQGDADRICYVDKT